MMMIQNQAEPKSALNLVNPAKPNSEQFVNLGGKKEAAPGLDAKLVAGKTAALSASSLGTSANKDMISSKTTGTMDKSAAFAGLKPWSKDWVFEGVIDQGPAPKPLFGSKEDLAQPTTLAQLSEMLRKGEAALQAQGALSPQESTLGNPQQKITGGEADGATDLKNLMQVAVQPQQAGAELMSKHAGMDNPQFHALVREQSELDPQQMQQQVQRPQLGATSLSGGEFLSTLAAVRGGAEQKQAGQFNDKEQGSGRQSDSNLRVLEGGRDVKETTAAAVLGSQAQTQHFGAVSAPAVEVTGHVTHGSMSQERLSSESLLGLSSGIKSLTSQGGGEIHVRLKPENLGELHLRVVTDGRQVGLQIHASDEHAKKILEESIGHLKENLAVHNLSLGAVDVSVTKMAAAFGGDLGRGDQGQGNNSNLMQQQQQGLSGFGGSGDFSGMSQGNQGRSGLWSGNEGNSFGSRAVAGESAGLAASAPGTARTQQRAANGRLDVRA